MANASAGSRHLRLVQYSQRHPGRLGLRLVRKMQSLCSRDVVADSVSETAPIAPTATNYYLTVMVPQYPAMGTRNGRELRTLCLVLDRLCMGQVDAACDVTAQRIKAIEQSINDKSWDRAQHAELIPTEGATLLDKDEQWMLARETELENRLRPRRPWRTSGGQSAPSADPQPRWSPQGKPGKGWRKGSGKGAKAPAPVPAPQPPA